MRSFSNPLTEYSPQMEIIGAPSRDDAWAESGGVFSAEEEADLAAELLGVSNERELDYFLSSLIKGAASALGKIVPAPVRKAVRGVLKTAMPIAGGVVGGIYGGPLGATIGKSLGTFAGQTLGLELEGLSPEDREFEATKQFVRFAGETVRSALERGATAHPAATASQAARDAAETYAPGLTRDPLTSGENVMHDIDRTQVGRSGYEMENEPYEAEGEGSDYGESEQEALAAELMELETEEEFESFLLKLLRNAASKVGGYINAQTGRSMGSLLKGAARQVLPVADQALGGPGDTGTREYESEYDQGEFDQGEYDQGESDQYEGEMEEQEWEAATTFVKLAEEAGKIAAQTPPDAPPDVVATNAVTQAAQVHAPALLTPPSGSMMAPQPPRPFPGRMPRYPRRQSGRWVRRGNQILLLGV
jgi:uncharacterized protein (DUF697 family)